MKIRISTLLICALFTAMATAQQPQPTATVVKLTEEDVRPVLDGEIDEVWDLANEYPIDRNFRTETPTIGNSIWKALWTPDEEHSDGPGVYLLFVVEDDNYWPHYLSGGANSWEYDKIEIYFDCNYELADGVGASAGNESGHHQIAMEFAEGKIDGTRLWGMDAADADEVWYSHNIINPDYVAEYFVPWEYLNDETGSPADLSGPIAFDVTIIDQDEGITTARQRGVWANEGLGGGDESWNNMDDCGILTFEGAEPPIWITSIEIAPGEITENNGTLMLEAVITPLNFTEGFRWSVVNGAAGTNGKALIDPKTGELTGVIDGTVTVTCMASTGFISDSKDIVISNQIVSLGDINLIRNGFFDNMDENGYPDEWEGGTSDDGDVYVNENGVTVHDPVVGGTAPWSYGFNQRNFGCNKTDTYLFSFVAWAESPRKIMVSFEDPANDIDGDGTIDYNRYGTSDSEYAIDETHYWWGSGPDQDPPQVWTGNSYFEMDLTTEPAYFEMDIVFDGKDPAGGEPTTEVLGFHMGLSDTIVYLDSVVLVNPADLELLDDYIPVTGITVSSAGDATTVASGSTLQMSASVMPGDADYPDVKWSVIPGTGWASIDENGLLTGDTAGMVTVVASAVDDSGEKDMMEIKVTWPVGISDYSVTPLKVYPNPAVDELTVELGRENAMVSIFNSLGQKMDQVLVTGTEYRFDISRYSSGIYYVKTGNSVVKFIK